MGDFGRANDAASRARAAIAALNARDFAGARSAIEPMTKTHPQSLDAWLILAIATNMLGDHSAAERAVDTLLELDPDNVRGMKIKGDCRAAANDPRAAVSFYKAVIAYGRSEASPAPDIAAELPRLISYCQAIDKNYRDHLEQFIRAKGVRRSSRFNEAMDLMYGNKQIFLQQPTVFYFPGLPQIQFFEREDFDWTAELELATSAIAEEAQLLLSSQNTFVPYITKEENRPHDDHHGLNDNENWGAFHIYRSSQPVKENIAKAPNTFAAINRVPLCHSARRTPTVMFSLLRARTSIPPHNGMLNTRLICHLPLIVPPGCGLRVGNEVREWRVGETLIFDDSIEHEAWNNSGDDRIVLLFDIWRPELTEDERAAVSAIFEAIDSYGDSGG